VEIIMEREWVILLVFLIAFIVLTAGIGTSLVIILRYLHQIKGLLISTTPKTDSKNGIKVNNNENS